MTDLGEKLEGLGLSQYLESFVTEGFDTWEILLDITESDLSVSTANPDVANIDRNYLNVKLGHRRVRNASRIESATNALRNSNERLQKPVASRRTKHWSQTLGRVQ
jgi:hypothetical protein